MGKIVAIGGGEIGEGETLAIDKEHLPDGQGSPPSVVHPDREQRLAGVRQTFQDVYGSELGCDADVLYLLGISPTKRELEEKIL